MEYIIIFAMSMVITSIIFNAIRILISKKNFIKLNNEKTEYDIYLEKLLKEIKTRGILIKIMKREDSFLTETFTFYNKNLGAVPIRDILGNISNVYVAYEDFDGSIKYYDYPQIMF